MKVIHTLLFKRTSVFVFYVLIILGSSIPGQNIPSVFQLTPDKLIHCLEYLILGFLLTRWLDTEVQTPLRKVIILVLMIGGVCGMIDELYQNLTPNRTPDFYDWCLDFIGISISIPTFFFFKRKFL